MNRAALAKEILENPVWDETFETLGKYYYEEFRAAADRDTRDRIALANDILDDFKSFLNQAVVEGLNLNVGDNNE